MMHLGRIISTVIVACAFLGSICGQHNEPIFAKSAEILDPFRQGYYIDYTGLVDSQDEINRLVRELESDKDLTPENYLALHCLAYNLHVIQSILSRYPIQSIKQVASRADKVFEVGGTLYTFESLRSHLVEKYEHGAIHYLLVDGTINSASLPIHRMIRSDQSYLDNLLSSVLDNRLFVQVNMNSESITLSNVFDKYQDDFGGIDRIIGLIEVANTINLDGFKVTFDKEDLALNDVKNALQTRFIPDRMLTNGEYEVRLIENYFTQSAPNTLSSIKTRTSVMTHFLNVIIGSRRNYNIGFIAKARSITVDGSTGIFNYLNGIHIRNRPLSTFNGSPSYQRVGFTAIGPQLRYRPRSSLRGNSQMVHTLAIPMGNSLEGTPNTLGFIDWEGISLYNQWLYHYDITAKSNLFYDIGFHLENIDGRLFRGDGGNVNITTALNVIYHYYPAPKWTLLSIATVAPRIALSNPNNFATSFDPFGQIGLGLRRYLSYSVEAELIISQVIKDTLRNNAQMINVGLRYTVD